MNSHNKMIKNYVPEMFMDSCLPAKEDYLLIKLILFIQQKEYLWFDLMKKNRNKN